MNLYIGQNKINIIVLGDIILDHTLEGKCHKIANEGPVPVIDISGEKYSLGGCGNVLMNCFSLGISNAFIFSKIGNDTNGAILESLLPKNTTSFLFKNDSIPTITKTRIYCDKKLVARYDIEKIKCTTEEEENEIVERIKSIINLKNNIVILFSDYNKGFLTKNLCQTVIKLANEYNITTIVDPKNDYTKYIGCTIIKPNRMEVRNLFNLEISKVPSEPLSGRGFSKNELIEIHKEIESRVQCKLSVITLSEDGISAYKDGQLFRVSENIKDVIDVTGAGDVVCSVIGVFFNYIKDIQVLISIANNLASISVSHVGSYIVSQEDLLSTFKYITDSKVITIDKVAMIPGKTITFTNGCFDIIHSAHIELFKFCKKLGDIVIVGLNSDNSIKRLKGDSRPINSLDERIKILDSIEYIDFIIVFEEDTPLEIIKNINPDYLVKGGDYIHDNIIGKEYAKNTIIFDYINGLSTTNTINKIKQNRLQ